MQTLFLMFLSTPLPICSKKHTNSLGRLQPRPNPIFINQEAHPQFPDKKWISVLEDGVDTGLGCCEDILNELVEKGVARVYPI